MGKKMISTMLEETQIERLKALSQTTRIKVADYIREGVELVLSKYQKEPKKSTKKGGE